MAHGRSGSSVKIKITLEDTNKEIVLNSIVKTKEYLEEEHGIKLSYYKLYNMVNPRLKLPGIKIEEFIEGE